MPFGKARPKRTVSRVICTDLLAGVVDRLLQRELQDPETRRCPFFSVAQDGFGVVRVTAHDGIVLNRAERAISDTGRVAA